MAHSFTTAPRGAAVVTPGAETCLSAIAPDRFMFATGIECSAPTIQNGRVRRDLLEECRHYDR